MVKRKKQNKLGIRCLRGSGSQSEAGSSKMSEMVVHLIHISDLETQVLTGEPCMRVKFEKRSGLDEKSSEPFLAALGKGQLKRRKCYPCCTRLLHLEKR